MGLYYSSIVRAPLADVFAWHTRRGALARLSPPWIPVRPVEEAGSLRDGRAVLRFPGGLRWVAEHRPEGYDPPHRFVDEVVSKPFDILGWRHTHLFAAEGTDATLVEDRVETPVPSSRLREMFAYRHRQLGADVGSHQKAALLRPEPMTVAITGSSGVVGAALSAFLSTGGHRVVRLVRNVANGPDERLWRPDKPDPRLLEGIDAVVHLAGASIAGRFSDQHKRAILDSRVGPTRLLAEASAAASQGTGPSVFVSASAIGFYGPDRGDELLTEPSSKGNGFLAGVVAEWEAACGPATTAGLRVVQVRTGIVQSPRGGVLGILYPVFLAGLGGKLAGGGQWMSWIGIDDLIDVYYRALVDPGLSGPVNAVSPEPVSNGTYTSVLARVLRRPALLGVPTVAPRLVLGREGSRELAEASQRVMPAVLLGTGHHFRHPELEGALRHLLGHNVSVEAGPLPIIRSLRRQTSNLGSGPPAPLDGTYP